MIKTVRVKLDDWAILFATTLAVIAAGSYTTLAGLLLTKLSLAYAWNVTSISTGVAVNMIMYGLVAPFGIFFMERYGVRHVSITALCLLIVGSAVCLIPNIGLFNVAWGLLVGFGTGLLTMAYGAYVARRWFKEKIGIVTGVLTASAVVGQFALLPLWSALADIFGWRAPLFGCAILSFLAILAVIVFVHDKPSPEMAAVNRPFEDGLYRVIETLLLSMRSPAFWVLVLLFLICGATTNGIMWSHFTPAAVDCGIDVTVASSILFLIGVFNIVGTIGAGWLSDRMSSRLILAFIFVGRAGTLLWLPLIFVSGFDPRLIIFGVFFGVLDVATVPPIIVLCNRIFGRDGPAIFGWINAFHQIGAGAMAFTGAIIRTNTGSYNILWILSGIFCLIAAGAVFMSAYERHS